jgi:acetyltransferase-like isoleucine patch superfamily enzyme
MKRGKRALSRAFARHFLHPHFERVGVGCEFDSPLFVKVVGAPIVLGEHVQINAMLENQVRLAVWGAAPGLGGLSIGDYSVINPGARISSGCRIEIGKNALFASNVCITDTDWHGHYDRVLSTGGYAPVTIEDNVWLGEGVIVCKGVTIGNNNIVGAGSIVVSDIPANSVAVGNPARVVSELDPTQKFVSRSDVLSGMPGYLEDLRELERDLMHDNTLLGYLRYLLFPQRGD